MKNNPLFLIIIICLFTTSCELMQRHEGSGYAGAAPPPMYSRSSGTNFGAGQSNVSLSDSEDLNKMESHLTSQQEIKQYYHYKPLLKTDQKRIQFLQQSGVDARNKWVKRYLFPLEKKDFNQRELEMIAKRDITVGMSKKAVEESWGSPLEKQAAGKAIRGNEMWIYKKLSPTSNGYKTEYRHVYFEAGHVAGWETK